MRPLRFNHRCKFPGKHGRGRLGGSAGQQFQRGIQADGAAEQLAGITWGVFHPGRGRDVMESNYVLVCTYKPACNVVEKD